MERVLLVCLIAILNLAAVTAHAREARSGQLVRHHVPLRAWFLGLGLVYGAAGGLHGMRTQAR
jgi:hypothetical protein